MKILKRNLVFASTFLLLFCSTLAQVPEKEKVAAGAERAFEKAAKAVNMPAPGCAIGVSVNGESVFEKAFGLAEMEHKIPNTPQTIFESGSVAKQFTAAALVLLEQDGKLKLDDPVRKYIPEMPEYEAPMTIRHLLNHTAGLRDWGSVMALTGVGRGDRVINQDVAFDVIIRQKGLDFTPGAEYSYSNSGYQLAAIVVERVSKQKFGDFVSERFFKPLKMTSSSWRDDYQRLVPGRAQAYSRQGATAPWRLNMPFMNVYGNGGMLTTVGDWLRWNAMLDSRSMGAPLVEALETQGMLNDGRKIIYALGLNVDTYRGMRDISHGGSTAGYQTFLARYPEKKVSVAVLCNGTSPSAGVLAASITDEIFGPFPSPAAQADGSPLSVEQLQKYVGIWRDEKTRAPANLVVDGNTLRMNGTPLRPQQDGAFLLGSSVRMTFEYDKDGRRIAAQGNQSGDIRRFVRETEWKPSATELGQFAGDWYSDEAEAKFTISIEGNQVFLVQRPLLRMQLRPLYKDHFSAQSYTLWVTRDASGKVDKLHVGGSRMRDMPFVRMK
jgi:CubicO group peptidase (beta-lactamase class C family)